MDLLGLFNSIERDRATDKDDRILIVDSLNSFIRVFSTMPVLSGNGEYQGGLVGFLRSIGLNIREFQPTRCILVFDGKGGSQRRRKVYSEYKNKTRNAIKPVRVEGLDLTPEEEMASFRDQINRLAHYLDCLPVQIVCIDNIEADDSIAYIAKQHFSDKSKIRIVSTDRDYLQLVSDNIEVYSPIKKKLYNVTDVEEEYQIPIEAFLIYRMFTGDTSDNIPGINGVGIKTFKKIFQNLLEKRESDFEKYINFCKIVEKPNKTVQTIIQKELDIHRNHALMQLKEVGISGHAKISINNILGKDIQPVNKHRFKQLLNEDALNTTFSKDVDRWLYNTFNSLSVWATR